jgi:hypothetical protein
MLQSYIYMFGKEFINNAAIVFTHWQQSKRAKDQRFHDQITEEGKKISINKQLTKLGFNILN